MKNLVAFIAINAALWAANAVAASSIALAGQLVAKLSPEFADSSWLWLAIVYAGAAAGVAFAIILAWLATLRPVERTHHGQH